MGKKIDKRAKPVCDPAQEVTQEVLELLKETNRIGVPIAYMALLDCATQLAKTLPTEDIITALNAVAKKRPGAFEEA